MRGVNIYLWDWAFLNLWDLGFSILFLWDLGFYYYWDWVISFHWDLGFDELILWEMGFRDHFYWDVLPPLSPVDFVKIRLYSKMVCLASLRICVIYKIFQPRSARHVNKEKYYHYFTGIWDLHI